MINYIGDISANDALVLKNLAENSTNILEFGVGGSTQIVAEYTKGQITSIDTSDSWIHRTQRNLALLNITPANPIQWYSYEEFMGPNISRGQYDFIFNDGVDDLRRSFALAIWKNLKIGGAIAFHDTRRPADVRNALELIAHHQNEVADVYFNVCSSNITVIYKKALEQWENWQITEHREPWQLGYGDPPPGTIV